MSKRFTDITKWDRPWFRRLRPRDKLIFLYLLDKCNRAGFWEMDEERLLFDTGLTQLDKPIVDILALMKDVITNENFAYIKDFIEFQYPGGLQSNNRAHTGIIKLLEKMKPHFKGLTRPLQGCKEIEIDIDKDKDKEKDKVKRTRFKPPTLEDIEKWASEKTPELDCHKFFNHYQSKGWKVGKSAMKDWHAAAYNAVTEWAKKEAKVRWED